MLGEAAALDREIILLLNSDEEVGSPVSRRITERLASQCNAVFVLEPAQGIAYKTARKGTGNWRIDIKGVAAHAGVDFQKGASAIAELAHVVQTVSGWTDLKRGTTVSVGVAGGGTKTNVIPAEAWAEVDVRIARKADGHRMDRRFARLRPVDSRCSLAATGGINRPPMERTKVTVTLTNTPLLSLRNLASLSTKQLRAARPMATSLPLSAFPRSMAWEPSAREHMPPTNPS
jgi:glutamate carboxypeptidase